MLWKVRKVDRAKWRTLSLGSVERALDEDKACEGEGDGAGGFRNLVCNDGGEKTTKRPSYMELVCTNIK